MSRGSPTRAGSIYWFRTPRRLSFTTSFNSLLIPRRSRLGKPGRSLGVPKCFAAICTSRARSAACVSLESWKSCSLKSHPEWNKSVELLLGSSDRAECFAQLFAGERRQVVGPNEVIWRAALANLPSVVIEPNLPDKGKGLPKRLRGFLVQRPQLFCGNQPIKGGGDGDAVRQGMESRQIGDRYNPSLLNIDLLTLPPRHLEPVRQRHIDVRGGSSEMGEEAGMLSCFLKHGHQRRRNFEPARDMPEIEGNCCPDQVRRVEGLKTVSKGLNPARLGHTPERVFSHHTRNVGPEPCAAETRIHVGSNALEIGVHLLVAGIGIGERVILIRSEGEFSASHAPEREPSPGPRSGPVTRYGEIEQTYRDGVTAELQYPSDVGRAESSLDQGREHPRQLFGSGVKGRFGGRVEDGRAKGKRTPIGESHQVARRHDSHDLASRV